jgi:hypothetical protein
MRATLSTITLLASCLVFSNCTHKRDSATELINHKASLTGDLPFNPFRWSVISIGIDSLSSTMFTLYGNDVAVVHARSDPQGPYPVGSQLSLVTWTQREDEHWFGARNPGSLKSVEFVRVEPGGEGTPLHSYRVFEGTPLKETTSERTSDRERRLADILTRRAAVMP